MMLAPHYISKSYKTLKNKGFIELTKETYRFLLTSNRAKYYRFKFNTFRNYLEGRIKYEAPANPYKIIYIDPNDVNYLLKTIPGIKGLGQICDGDWDQSNELTPVENYYVIEGLKQRFEEGKRWEDTIYYERAVTAFFEEERDNFIGCENIEEFLKIRCAYLDNIYSDIKNDGYQSNTNDDNSQNNIHRYHYRDQLEVLVLIDRDGRFLLNDGKHRFAIAQVLDLTIPAQVVCRHEEWQLYRDKLYDSRTNFGAEQMSESNSYHKDILHHPDLKDI